MDGWELDDVRGIRYVFVKSAPRRVVYRLDYQAKTAGPLTEYRRLCEEMGWEWVARMGNWIYLRRPDDGENPTELYTDNASRLERYRTQLRILAAALAPVCYALVVYPLIYGSPAPPWVRVLQAAAALLTLPVLYAIGRLWAVIRRLESNPRE